MQENLNQNHLELIFTHTQGIQATLSFIAVMVDPEAVNDRRAPPFSRWYPKRWGNESHNDRKSNHSLFCGVSRNLDGSKTNGTFVFSLTLISKFRIISTIAAFD